MTLFLVQDQARITTAGIEDHHPLSLRRMGLGWYPKAPPPPVTVEATAAVAPPTVLTMVDLPLLVDDNIPPNPKKATTPTKTVFGGGSFGFHNNLWIPALVLMLLWGGTVIALWMNVRGKYSLILSELSAPTGQAVQEIFSNLKLERDSIEREMSRRMLGKEMELKTQLEKIIEENTHLEQEMGDLRENHGGLYNEQKESRMIRRADALVDHMWRLEEAIRKESHRTILERFGPGPHEVEFLFKIDGTDRSFVVEMAPVDEVPHAIHLFMEQVEHGLWNGCYFYLNGPHIVQVGPRLSEQGVSEGNERARIAPFKARGLDQLSFPDYSDNYPHVTWTVGYTGRPGGIDWYINKIDNSKLHGRGGQVQHALKEHGDPCFGKVTRGQMDATVLFRQPIYGDGSPLNHFFKDPIQIISATILTKRPEGAVDEKPAIEDPVRASEQERPRPEMPKIDHAAEP